MTTPCTKKIRYRDRLGALIALAGKPGAKGNKRAYRCPHCQGWHLTSQDKRA